MKIRLGIFLIFTIISVPAQAQQGAEFFPIKKIITDAKKFDGKLVKIRGEAIGYVMPRGDFAWVNFEDATGRIGVWMPLSEARKIKLLGNYDTKGDVVDVVGVFKRADPKLNGEFAVRAQSLTVVMPGHAIEHEFSILKAEIAAVLLVCALLLWGFRQLIKYRTRTGK